MTNAHRLMIANAALLALIAIVATMSRYVPAYHAPPAIPPSPSTPPSSPYILKGEILPNGGKTHQEALAMVDATTEGPQPDGAYVLCAYDTTSQGYVCVRSYGARDGKIHVNEFP